jgi:cysteine desulfurase
MYYFDYAASTPVHDVVRKAMYRVYEDIYANPQSTHTLGRKASCIIDEARNTIATHLQCKAQELFFTSGATESNNWVLHNFKKKNNHLIISGIEHHAVLNVAKYLEDTGVFVTYILPDEHGIINIDDILNAVNDDTVLISLMAVNNELGTVQRINDLVQKVYSLNEKRG